MHNFRKKEIKSKEEFTVYFEERKYKNKEYLNEMQNFLDRVDNVKDENLKEEIIYKMHRIERIIMKISNDIINEYKEGENLI